MPGSSAEPGIVTSIIVFSVMYIAPSLSVPATGSWYQVFAGCSRKNGSRAIAAFLARLYVFGPPVMAIDGPASKYWRSASTANGHLLYIVLSEQPIWLRYSWYFTVPGLL